MSGLPTPATLPRPTLPPYTIEDTLKPGSKTLPSRTEGAAPGAPPPATALGAGQEDGSAQSTVAKVRSALHDTRDVAQDATETVKAIQDLVEAVAALMAQFTTSPILEQSINDTFPDWARGLIHGVIEITGSEGFDAKTNSPFGLDPDVKDEVIKTGALRGMNTELERQLVATSALLAKAFERVDTNFNVVGTNLDDIQVFLDPDDENVSAATPATSTSKSKKTKTSAVAAVKAASAASRNASKTGGAKKTSLSARLNRVTLYKALAAKLRSGRQMATALTIAYYFSPTLEYWTGTDRVDSLVRATTKGAAIALSSGRSTHPLAYSAGLFPSPGGKSKDVIVTLAG